MYNFFCSEEKISGNLETVNIGKKLVDSILSLRQQI